ncbi:MULTISPECIES: hypothetical protein [Clostridium]|nr:hypothetical protein [Clostridium sporogenes]AJD32953.1 hypothetical protein T258_989 [Clostridium botulinum Prevot_594]KRU42372.1 hypothetical protein VT94_15980 [Clostridium sporogenes]OQP92300.1 hypothetical protein VT93_0235860 [Clostridium sporogenes]OQP99740.1 hypothetical protein VT96_0220910 [Clostridium sporogenes]SQB31212.1 Uncharacterised protein [Clostridium sporogenes]
MNKRDWGKRFKHFFFLLSKLKKQDWYKIVELLIKLIDIFRK